MTRFASGCLVLLLVGFFPLHEVLAHHAASGLYDRDAWLTITGRVESVFWRNPHVRFRLMVESDDGAEVPWEIEAGSVNSLERMGIGEEMLTPGSIVEVSGLPGRQGQPIAFARSISSSGGSAVPLFFDLSALDEHYELGREDQASDTGEPLDLFRVWVPVSVPNTGSGRIQFPLTEAARAARASWDPASDPSLGCEPPGMPAAMDNPYPIAFEDRGSTIVLRLEEWDGVRTIHMDPASADRSATAAATRMGYSVGRWDGDALVVETSRISNAYFDDLGTPQSDALRLTERFVIDPDDARLSWVAEITDPVNFTETVVLEIQWEWIPGNEIKPFNCALPEQG
ncbi:MAG: DUF6152 family protein [Gammaproteobacteria bacterium]|jgi:hypothetical protein